MNGSTESPPAAVRQVKSCIEAEPHRADLYLALADLHQNKGDLLAAGVVLEQGAEVCVSDPTLHLKLSEWLERRGDLQGALSILERTYTLLPPRDRLAVLQRMLLLTIRLRGSAVGLEEYLKSRKLEPPELIALSVRQWATKPAAVSAVPEIRPLLLPGGTAPIFRVAPFLDSKDGRADFLERFFTYLLETEPVKVSGVGTVENPRRYEAAAFYRQYGEFVSWLKGERNIPKPVRLSFSSRPEDIESANRVLSFFGTKVSAGRDGSGVNLRTEFLKDRNGDQHHKVLLKWLGINPSFFPPGSTLEFDFADSEIPVVLGIDYWANSILKRDVEAPGVLFEEWLERPDALKLYVALARLPGPAQTWFSQSFERDLLLKTIGPRLLAVGGLLRFDTEGKIELPGGTTADSLWGELVGAAPSAEANFTQRLFSKDHGRVLTFLAYLSRCDREVATWVFSDPKRFRALYNTIEEPGPYFEQGGAFRKFHDWGDLLILLNSDGKRVFFPGSQSTWIKSKRGRSRSAPPAPTADHGSQPPELFAANDDLVLSLLEQKALVNSFPAVRKLATLQYISSLKPPLAGLSDKFDSDSDFPLLSAQFGLIYDLRLGDGQLDQFVARARQLNLLSRREERSTTLALFQSPLVILRALVREKAISEEDATELVRLHLAGSFTNLAATALGTAVFFSENLVPRLRMKSGYEGDVSRVLLQALTSDPGEVTFTRGEQEFSLSIARSEMERASRFIEGQEAASLDEALNALLAVRDLQAGQKRAFERAKFSCISLLRPVRSLEEMDERHRKLLNIPNSTALRESLVKLGAEIGRGESSSVGHFSNQLAKDLAPFLAEALVALVYAIHIREGNIVAENDANLIRKHRFTGETFDMGVKGPHAEGGAWGSPVIVHDRSLGFRIEGSLTGVSRALNQLRGEQLAGAPSSRFADSMFPVSQIGAVEALRPWRINQEVIDYMGRMIDLSRNLIAASLLDSELREFCVGVIHDLCGARRAWLFSENLDRGQLSDAVALLLPSELFWLAENFRARSESGGTPWYFSQDAEIDRLARSVERPALDQLGFPALTWFGLESLILRPFCPIESLTSYTSPNRLAERGSELALRVAEIFWRTGLPPPLLKPVCERVCFRVLPRVRQTSTRDWRALAEMIHSISESDVMAAFSDLVSSQEAED